MSNQNKPIEDKRFLIGCTVTLLLVIFCDVLSIMCFDYYANGIYRKYYIFFVSGISFVYVLSYVISTIFLWKNNLTVFRSFLSAYVLLSIVVTVMYALQRSGFFEVFSTVDSFKEYLEKSGRWMPIVYTVLQFLQVVILPIPGFLSTATGVALFGPLKTLLFSFIGIVLGSFVAFFIGRKLGYKTVAWIVGKEELDKWLKKIKGKDNLILTLMFLFPLFPDDVLCFIAGLSSMSDAYFAVMIVLSRLLAIAGTCYFVNVIPFNTMWGLIIWGVLVATVVIAFLIIYKKIDTINEWIERKFPKKKGKKGKDEKKL